MIVIGASLSGASECLQKGKICFLQLLPVDKLPGCVSGVRLPWLLQIRLCLLPSSGNLLNLKIATFVFLLAAGSIDDLHWPSSGVLVLEEPGQPPSAHGVWGTQKAGCLSRPSL